MTVLFVLLEFAPVNTTGNFRSLKFIKYLPQFGIEPVVVSLPPEQGAKLFNAKIDNNLLKEIPASVPIYRIPCEPIEFSSNKLIAFIDSLFSVNDKFQQAWEKNLMAELPAIIEKHKPEALYVSMPPFSMGVTMTKIARKFSIPLVADMRDLWAYWGSSLLPTRFHFLAKKKQERKLFETAKKIVSVTPQVVDIFKKAHPHVPSSKFEIIYNGYDDIVSPPASESRSTNKFRIGYTGSFYYEPGSNELGLQKWWKRPGHKKLQYKPIAEDWKYRSPYYFLKTMGALFSKYPAYREKLQFDFIGKEPEWLKGMISEFDLGGNYKCHGFLPYQEVQQLQQSFDVFLATSEKVLDGEHYCLPSKVFDYLKYQKSVAAFVTPGIQKDFLMGAGIGVWFDPDDLDGSVEKLKDLIDKAPAVKLNQEYLQQFDRKNLAAQLANLFQKLKN